MTTTNQPTWALLANLGDVNPLLFGGVFVYTDTTGVYPPEVEIVESDDDDGEPTAWTVHRFLLEPCTLVNGVLSDNPFHPEHPAWFADKLSQVAESVGRGLSSLQAALLSDDVITRAFAWVEMTHYFGADEFDQYPLTLDRTEVNERYPQFSIGRFVDTCDDCGAELETCCDGIARCLECNRCPACDDGGMDAGDDSASEEKTFSVVEYSSFFAVRLNRTGDEHPMSDGVDCVFDSEGNPLSPGTEGFVEAWEDALNSDPSQAMEAYFPNASSRD